MDGGRRHGPAGYHSKRLSRAQQNASANDREVLGVLHAVEHFEIYLKHRQFTLITDCSPLLWLYTSQNLSKMHRWALKLMAYDMVLKWRRGTENVGPDALSRLRRCSSQKLDGEVFVPGNSGEEMPKKKPAGSVLDGVPLQQLAPPLEPLQQEDREQPQLGPLNDMPVELRPLVKTAPRRTDAGWHSLGGPRSNGSGRQRIDRPRRLLRTTAYPGASRSSGCGSDDCPGGSAGVLHTKEA